MFHGPTPPCAHRYRDDRDDRDVFAVAVACAFILRVLSLAGRIVATHPASPHVACVVLDDLCAFHRMSRCSFCFSSSRVRFSTCFGMHAPCSRRNALHAPTCSQNLPSTSAVDALCKPRAGAARTGQTNAPIFRPFAPAAVGEIRRLNVAASACRACSTSCSARGQGTYRRTRTRRSTSFSQQLGQHQQHSCAILATFTCSS